MGIDKSWMSLKNRACDEYEKDESSSENEAIDVDNPIDQGCRNMETMLEDLFGHVANSSNTDTSDKANRAKQSTGTICGRKSFASVLHDMRDPKTEVDPDLTEYWKATHQRRTDNTWCSDIAHAAMKQFEQVRNSQELDDPPLSTEEHLTKAFGARSGYLRGLGCGPKPLTSKNLKAKASEENIERQIEELKNELNQAREENEEREARHQREKDEREERFKKEIEEIEARIKAEFKAEFNEQLKIIVQLYGAPTTSSPPSTQNH